MPVVQSPPYDLMSCIYIPSSVLDGIVCLHGLRLVILPGLFVIKGSFLSVRFFVFSDPPGAKLGDGGATLHALDQLVHAKSRDYIRKCEKSTLLANKMAHVHSSGSA